MPTISITDSDGIQVINDCYIEYANFAVSTILNRRFNGTMKFKISYNDYLWNYFSHWLHMVSETYDRERNSISPIIRRRNLFVDSGEYEGWSFRDVIITGLETTQTLIHGQPVREIVVYLSFDYYTTPTVSSELPSNTSSNEVLVYQGGRSDWVSINISTTNWVNEKHINASESFKKMLNNLIDNL